VGIAAGGDSLTTLCLLIRIYSPEPVLKGRAFSMSPRVKQLDARPLSPGPIYDVRHAPGSDGPRYSMLGRKDRKDTHLSPGPGLLVRDVVPPARQFVVFGFLLVAGAYDAPQAIAVSPGKSMGGRHELKTTKDETPGPGSCCALGKWSCPDSSVGCWLLLQASTLFRGRLAAEGRSTAWQGTTPSLAPALRARDPVCETCL
jgi:hypothetical protein